MQHGSAELIDRGQARGHVLRGRLDGRHVTVTIAHISIASLAITAAGGVGFFTIGRSGYISLFVRQSDRAAYDEPYSLLDERERDRRNVSVW